MFPCGYSSPPIFSCYVAIAFSTWRVSSSRQPVIPYWLDCANNPAQIFFFSRGGERDGLGTRPRELRLPQGALGLTCMYDIDRFTGSTHPDMPIFGRVGTSPRSQFPSVGQISNEFASVYRARCGYAMDRTHLGSVDEYLDDFLDPGRRLQDGVPLKELFARDTLVSHGL